MSPRPQQHNYSPTTYQNQEIGAPSNNIEWKWDKQFNRLCKVQVKPEVGQFHKDTV